MATAPVTERMTDGLWKEFYDNGFVKLGRTVSDQELGQLTQRIEDIMMGKVQYGERLLMQLDPSTTAGQNEYGSSVERGQSTGFKGATGNYRKIGEAGCGLEVDDLFLAFMRKPIFKDICDRVYGSHTSGSVYRAMVFNKPPKKGTNLPWHQDGGDWWALDRDPLVFLWTAIDPATKENGCVQAIRGSYKHGIVSKRGHTLSEADVSRFCPNDQVVDLECAPGETWLVHNWTIHRSGTNTVDIPRKAFSVNYIDGRTRVLSPRPALAGDLGKDGQAFPVVWDSPFSSQPQ